MGQLFKHYLQRRGRPIISPELIIFFDVVLLKGRYGVGNRILKLLGQEKVDRCRQLIHSLTPRCQAILHLTLKLLLKLCKMGASSETLAKIFGTLGLRSLHLFSQHRSYFTFNERITKTPRLSSFSSTTKRTSLSWYVIHFLSEAHMLALPHIRATRPEFRPQGQSVYQQGYLLPRTARVE